jgi:hypothetical protein
MDLIEKENKQLSLIAAAVTVFSTCCVSNESIVHGRLPKECDADNDKIVGKIVKMKQQKLVQFTRMYWLSPMCENPCSLGSDPVWED